MGDIRVNIENIKDPQLKIYAIAVDKNFVQDGEIAGEEIEVFAQGAKEYYGATDADLEAMGLKLQRTTVDDTKSAEATTQSATTNPIAKQEPAKKTYTKKEQKRFHNDVKDQVKSLVKQGITNEDLLTAVKEHFAIRNNAVGIMRDANGQPVIQDEYKESIKELEELVKNADYSSVTSKKDVKGFKKSTLAKMSNPTSFQKDVAEILEKSAKTSAVDKRTDAIFDTFNKALGSGHKFEEAVKAVEASLKKDKTDYNKEAIKQIQQEARSLAVDYVLDILNTADLIRDTKKELAYIPNLEEDIAKIDKQLETVTNEATKADLEQAKAQIEARIANAKAAEKELPKWEADVPYADAITKATGKMEIRSILREKLGAKNDEYIADAIQDLKVERKLLARENKVKENYQTSVSDKDMVHQLKVAENGISRGKFIKQYTLITGLTHESTKHAQELYTKLRANQDFINDDGTFDEQALAEFVGKYVSVQNNRLDREDKDFNASELKNLMDALESRTGKTFTKSEAKALAKMCQYKIQHPDRLSPFVPVVIGGAIGAISGAVGGFLAKAGGLMVTQDVKIKLTDSVQIKNLVNDLEKQGIQYTKTDLTQGAAQIKIHQQVIMPDERKANTLTGLVNGLPIGAALGALAGMIWGGDVSELTCISTSVYDNKDPKFTNPERFKTEFIDVHFKKNRFRNKAFKVMVDKYVEQYGKDWHAAFWQDMRQAGGFGSDVNPEECRRFFSKYKARTIEKTPAPEKLYDRDDCETDVTITTTVQHTTINGNKTTWEKIAGQYDCLQQFGPKVAIRMMKVIQAITDDNYDLERIHDIAVRSLKSKSIRTDFSNEPGLDVNKFIDTLKATTPGEVKMPDELTNGDADPCKRDETKSLKAVVTDRSGKVAPKIGVLSDTRTVSGKIISVSITHDGKTKTFESGAQADKYVRDNLQGYKKNKQTTCGN